MSKVIAMWAHPRAVSTAFLRMMIERGDITVVHEPLVTLTDEGKVPVPGTDGGSVEITSTGELLAQFKKLAQIRPVFFKDTVEYRYQYLFDHPEEIADIEHTFIVRDPKKAINSHYHVKPTVACHEIGYEHQYDLFELVRAIKGKPPTVVHAERLLREPETVIGNYCRAVGLPFLPEALQWRPEDRTEWQRTRKWHLDAIGSSGFSASEKQYDITVDNNDTLKSYYDYHYPFYEKLIQHSI